MEILTEYGCRVKGYLGSGSYGIIVYVEESGDTYAAKAVPKVLSSAGDLKMWPKLRHLNVLVLVEIVTCEEAYTLKKVDWK